MNYKKLLEIYKYGYDYSEDKITEGIIKHLDKLRRDKKYNVILTCRDESILTNLELSMKAVLRVQPLKLKKEEDILKGMYELLKNNFLNSLSRSYYLPSRSKCKLLEDCIKFVESNTSGDCVSQLISLLSCYDISFDHTQKDLYSYKSSIYLLLLRMTTVKRCYATLQLNPHTRHLFIDTLIDFIIDHPKYLMWFNFNINSYIWKLFTFEETEMIKKESIEMLEIKNKELYAKYLLEINL